MKNISIPVFLIFTFNAFSIDLSDALSDIKSQGSDSLRQSLSGINYCYRGSRSDTVSRISFFWYPQKSLDDIFNYIPGYYFKLKDIGQLNEVYFNQGRNTVIYKNGIPFDDDINFLSRNEIEAIESDGGFGNNPYNGFNSVNFIQRQIFTVRPFTEIAFYQDRYENLFFDGNYSQNLFGKFNLALGLTKHSYDGLYNNSDFDKWLGRIALQYLSLGKLKLFFDFNYGIIDRGENGGLKSDSIDINNKNVVFNRTRAVVKYPGGRINKERIQFNSGIIINWSRKIFSELHLYSYRKNTVLNKLPVADSFYTNLSYNNGGLGLKISQHILHKLGWINIRSRTEAAVNSPWSQNYIENNFDRLNYNERKFMFMQELESTTGFLTAIFYINAEKNLRGKDNRIPVGYGGRVVTDISIGLNEKIILDIFYRKLNNYLRARASFLFKYGKVTPEFYYYKTSANINGINFNAQFTLSNINIELLFSRALKNVVASFPRDYGSINLFYENTVFNNKLKFRIGSVSRYWSRYEENTFSIPENITLDLYFKGKIGRAYFGIAFENVLDRIIYNTAFYPFTDRGGLFNVLSRFELIWNFTD